MFMMYMGCMSMSYSPSPKPAKFTACTVIILLNDPVPDVGAQASKLGAPDHGTWSKEIGPNR